MRYRTVAVIVLSIGMSFGCANETKETVCSDKTGCGPSQYCSKPDGACSESGTCKDLPGVCAQVFAPVCGCDGVTYPNTCEANRAGVNIVSSGNCTTPPAAACTANAQCAGGEYCRKASGDCAGTGVCAIRPSGCIALWDPVTGCDGNIYGNSCEAARAGISLQ